MSKLVRTSQSYDMMRRNPDSLRYAVSDAINSALIALMWDIERQENIQLPATIKLEFEVELWDWQVKAVMEWGDDEQD